MEAELNLLSGTGGGERVFVIDASSANKERRTGVENYAREVIEAMKKQALREGEKVLLYSPTALDETLGTLPEGWSSAVLDWPLGRGWMAGRVRWELMRKKPSVLFVPAQAIPHAPKGVQIVTTIHDVAFARQPDLYEPSVRKRLQKVTRRAVRRAHTILVPSQATASDLLELYKVSQERIVVTPLAPSIRQSATDPAKTLQHYRLGTKYFLTVGRLEKKKNISTLIKGFELFKSRRGVGDPYELILVGEPGFGYEELKKYLDFSPQKNLIRSLGYVPDEQVAHLMSQATAYAFPSWYEGFGIPNLEAMAAGTALLASDIPAHTEVVGDAGLLVPPTDAEQWAQAMENIVRDPSVRQTLIDNGSERVKTFSWQITAQKTWEVLRSLV